MSATIDDRQALANDTWCFREMQDVLSAVVADLASKLKGMPGQFAYADLNYRAQLGRRIQWITHHMSLPEQGKMSWTEARDHVFAAFSPPWMDTITPQVRARVEAIRANTDWFERGDDPPKVRDEISALAHDLASNLGRMASELEATADAISGRAA